MTRNRLALGVGVVSAVVLVGLFGTWLLFLDTPPVTGTELNATTPDPTRSTAPPEFSMVVTVESRSLEDGSLEANWSAGARYRAASQESLGWVRIRGPTRNFSETSYQRYAGETTHRFIEYHNSDRNEFADSAASIRTDLESETEILRTDNASNTYRYYRKGSGTEFEVVPDQVPPLGFLHTIPFERAGSATHDGDRVETYVPVDGWTETVGSVSDDEPDTYLSNTTGLLYVDSESGNIVYVDVSFTSTQTAVRAGRWFGDGGSRGHVTLRVEADVSDRSLKPAWADEYPFNETG